MLILKRRLSSRWGTSFGYHDTISLQPTPRKNWITNASAPSESRRSRGEQISIQTRATTAHENTPNLSHVSIYTLPGRVQRQPPPIIVEGFEEFEVEEILESQIHYYNKLQYFVDWKGYRPDERTWEPAELLKNAKDVIAHFHTRYPHRKICRRVDDLRYHAATHISCRSAHPP